MLQTGLICLKKDMALNKYLFEMPDGTIIEYDRDNYKETEIEWLNRKGYIGIDNDFLAKCRVYAATLTEDIKR